MKFTKPPTTFETQRKLLEGRGMKGDPTTIEDRLSRTNYYRLSAYWYTFREIDRTSGKQGDNLVPGCTFDIVWDRYCFDRKLRLLVMDAIERIEVALRTALAYHQAIEHGAFGYVDNPDALPKLKGAGKSHIRADFIQRIEEETSRAHEVFVDHFFRKYGDHHKHLPIWMATEVMTFRTVLTLFQNCSHKVKQNVASVFGMPDSVFSSWLLTLNAVRNVCAHHGRLWNREIGARPTIPTGKAYGDWNTPVLIKHDRMFATLTVINHCISQVARDDKWAARFKVLLDEHASVPIRYMGFPDKWMTSPLWAGAASAPLSAAPLPAENPFPK